MQTDGSRVSAAYMPWGPSLGGSWDRCMQYAAGRGWKMQCIGECETW